MNTDAGIQVCLICSKEFKKGKLLRHLREVHNMNAEEYYNKYLKGEADNPGTCKICGKPTRFYDINKGYSKYCSSKCVNHDPDLIAKKQESARITCLEKYGTEYAFQAEAVKATIKQAMLEKYGHDSPMKCKAIRERAVSTAKERYGGMGLGSSKIKAKAEQTCLERYGVSNPFASEAIKDNIKQLMLEKHGVPYHCMTDECRNSAVFHNSSCNLAFIKLLEEHNIKYEREFAIENKSYDFKVGNILIEINPTPTHNSTWGWRGNKEKGLPVNYHKEKTELAVRNGYRCIHLFDWDDYNKALKLLMKKDTVYARNCDVRPVGYDDANKFIGEHHLQGIISKNGNDKVISIGLYYNNELVSVMMFGEPRYNRNYEYELLRYCYNKNIIGGSKKLFQYFIKHYSPGSIISYCDLSKFTGKLYEDLGFKRKCEDVKPSKHWVHNKTLKHITDNLLRQRGFDQLLGNEYGCFGKGAINEDLMLSHGFVEIYDCGQATYIWKSQ